MPDGKLRLFTDGEMEVLRAVVKDVVEKCVNPRLRTPPSRDSSQSPDVYVVRVGTAGVPALDLGTDQGTGTSTGTAASDDSPGSAYCDVYRVGPDGTMERVGRQEKVYNYSSSAVTGPSWAVAIRDKFGRWAVVPTAVGSGGSSSGGTIVGPVHVVEENGTGTGGGWYCQAIEYNGSNWVVSAGPLNYRPVVEYNGLQPRKEDANSSPGSTVLARTLLYRDRNGNYFIDYPRWSDSDTLTITVPDTWVCTGGDLFVNSYQSTVVRYVWDNFTNFPNVDVRIESVP